MTINLGISCELCLQIDDVHQILEQHSFWATKNQ